jgi:hypothetical protein
VSALAIVKFGERIVVGSFDELFEVLLSPPPLMFAVLVTLFVPTAVPNPTLTAKLKTLLTPAAMAVELVQVTVCGDEALEVQVQFAAFAPPSVIPPADPPLTVIPVGNVSVIVIVPLLAAAPVLLTVKE